MTSLRMIRCSHNTSVSTDKPEPVRLLRSIHQIEEIRVLTPLRGADLHITARDNSIDSGLAMTEHLPDSTGAVTGLIQGGDQFGLTFGAFRFSGELAVVPFEDLRDS